MISPSDLQKLMASETHHAVLDIRERGAYQARHIFRTTSVPRRLLEVRLPVLVPARPTPIVLCDADGRLSALAAETLSRMGYTDVRPLAGGLAAWVAGGHPTAQGVNTPSKVFGELVLHDLRTPEITPLELSRRMAAGDDMVIVDTRTPEEYARGCLPGAWSMPGGELVLRLGELVHRPDTTIVVHCGGRTRSYLGAESVRKMSLPNPVVAVKNGTMGWELAGLTLERGASRWPPEPSAASRARAIEVARHVAATESVPLVSADDVKRLLAARDRHNAYVLDVRTSEEYAAEHIAGAIWAPGGQAVQATDDYIAVYAATVVLACDGSGRAVMTAAWLRQMGLLNAVVLDGGLPAWKTAGGAVESGHAAPMPWGYEAAREAVAFVEPGPLRDAQVIAVDPSDVYARGHVPGATWMCRSRLELEIGEVAPDKRRPLVVTCADGVQSTLSASTLAGLGYANVRALSGGTRAWTATGLRAETGLARIAGEVDDVVLKPYEKGRGAMEAYLKWEEALDVEGRSPNDLLPPGT